MQYSGPFCLLPRIGTYFLTKFWLPCNLISHSSEPRDFTVFVTESSVSQRSLCPGGTTSCVKAPFPTSTTHRPCFPVAPPSSLSPAAFPWKETGVSSCVTKRIIGVPIHPLGYRSSVLMGAVEKGCGHFQNQNHEEQMGPFYFP